MPDLAYTAGELCVYLCWGGGGGSYTVVGGRDIIWTLKNTKYTVFYNIVSLASYMLEIKIFTKENANIAQKSQLIYFLRLSFFSFSSENEKQSINEFYCSSLLLYNVNCYGIMALSNIRI